MNDISQKTSNSKNFLTGERNWYFVDLAKQVVGKRAVEIAQALRGKNRADFNYNFDLGGHVVVINAEKAVFTGNKLSGKKYYNHSGYPGGIRERTARVMLDKYPVELVQRVVKGLMPHNRLSRKQLTRLFVYIGPNHPHKAQEKRFLPIKKELNKNV